MICLNLRSLRRKKKILKMLAIKRLLREHREQMLIKANVKELLLNQVLRLLMQVINKEHRVLQILTR